MKKFLKFIARQKSLHRFYDNHWPIQTERNRFQAVTFMAFASSSAASASGVASVSCQYGPYLPW